MISHKWTECLKLNGPQHEYKVVKIHRYRLAVIRHSPRTRVWLQLWPQTWKGCRSRCRRPALFCPWRRACCGTWRSCRWASALRPSASPGWAYLKWYQGAVDSAKPPRRAQVCFVELKNSGQRGFGLPAVSAAPRRQTTHGPSPNATPALRFYIQTQSCLSHTKPLEPLRLSPPACLLASLFCLCRFCMQAWKKY